MKKRKEFRLPVVQVEKLNMLCSLILEWFLTSHCNRFMNSLFFQDAFSWGIKKRSITSFNLLLHMAF